MPRAGCGTCRNKIINNNITCRGHLEVPTPKAGTEQKKNPRSVGRRGRNFSFLWITGEPPAFPPRGRNPLLESPLVGGVVLTLRTVPRTLQKIERND